MNRPPTFPELLLQLRSGEDKHHAKESRMRQHLGTQRQRTSSHTLTVNSPDLRQDEMSERTEVTEIKRQVTMLQGQLAKQKNKQTEQSMLSSSDAVLELKQQVTELQSQMTKLRAQKDLETKTKLSKVKQTNTPFPRETPSKAKQKPPCRPKPGYCFRCSENGHVASICENDPKPSLVTDERKQLIDRQAVWDHQYGSNASGVLNAIQPS